MQKTIKRGKSIIRTVMTGMLAGVCVIILTVLISSFFLLKTGDPLGKIFPFALLAIFAGSFSSSLWSARTYGERPVAAGSLTGLSLLLLMTLCALVSSPYSGGWEKILAPPAVSLIASASGCALSLKKGKSAKKSLKKLRKLR